MSLIFLSIALFTGYHSFNNYDDIDFGNAVEIEHIYSPKVRLLTYREDRAHLFTKGKIA